MTMLDMYRIKKKRPVDPNAPPRPNLLNHEKRLKDTVYTMEQMQDENRRLRNRMESLEAKLANQTSYLNYLHQFITRQKG